jgi:hypothetical protein
MFIGRFKSDGQYHLLGHRPTGRSDMFSAESESNQDIGVVILPEGKTILRDLGKGDVFHVRLTGSKEEPSPAVYERHK